MAQIGRAPATTPGPGRSNPRPTNNPVNGFTVAALIAFGAMIALLGVALLQRHSGDNSDPAFAGAVLAVGLAVGFALLSDRRSKATR